MNDTKKSVFYAILAAALYAVNVPFSKLLIPYAAPTMMAAFLYLGAGLGMGILLLIGRGAGRGSGGPHLDRGDLPYTVLMVVLDIAAPIFLMYGVANTTAANVSLANNFEIAATALIAFLLFGERPTGKLWCAIGLVTAAGIVLGWEGGGEGVLFNRGTLFVLCACVCWGLENNCTGRLSEKSAEEIVLVKGFGSGLGALCIALCVGDRLPAGIWILCILLLGFVAYGLSIRFYITAQKVLGAAKTGAFYAVAPFLGVGFSFLMPGERPGIQFGVAFLLMLLGGALAV